MTFNDILFVSYYTPDYKAVAERYLLPSLAQAKARYGINFLVEAIGEMSWQEAVRFKPRFILRMMEEHHDRSVIVWLDADAEVIGDIRHFLSVGGDIACRVVRWNKKGLSELHCGTLWIRNTPAMREFVSRWSRFTKNVHPKIRCPEQESLYALLLEVKPDFWELPMSFATVLRDREQLAVVIQHQWSRTRNLHRAAPLYAASPYKWSEDYRVQGAEKAKCLALEARRDLKAAQRASRKEARIAGKKVWADRRTAGKILKDAKRAARIKEAEARRIAT